MQDDLKRKAHEALKDLVRLCENQISTGPPGFYIQVQAAHAAIDALYGWGQEAETMAKQTAEKYEILASKYDALAAGGGHAQNCECCPEFVRPHLPSSGCLCSHCLCALCLRLKEAHPYRDPRCRNAPASEQKNRAGDYQIRFDGPPGPEAGRFVEVETWGGKSFRLGEWVQDGDYWLLRVRCSSSPLPASAREKLPDEVERDFVDVQATVNVSRSHCENCERASESLARIRARLEDALANQRPPDTEADGCVYCGCCGHGPK